MELGSCQLLDREMFMSAIGTSAGMREMWGECGYEVPIFLKEIGHEVQGMGNIPFIYVIGGMACYGVNFQWVGGYGAGWLSLRTRLGSGSKDKGGCLLWSQPCERSFKVFIRL